MPNRIIKESICRSETINSLKPFEEVLFYRLIVVCDDYGRFDGRPSVIKGYCFPLKDTAVTDIKAALDKLIETGLVELYEVQGRPVLQLPTWSRHQQIRAKKSKYPSPDEADSKTQADDASKNQNISSDISCSQMISDDCNSPRNRNTRIENRESRSVNACARETGTVRRFEDFWAAYPNKQRRGLTERSYCSLMLSGDVGESDLLEAARNYAEYVRESGDKMYMPNNWLDKYAFEDFLPGNYVRKRQGDSVQSGGVDAPEMKTDQDRDNGELVGEDEEWWKYGLNAQNSQG